MAPALVCRFAAAGIVGAAEADGLAEEELDEELVAGGSGGSVWPQPTSASALPSRQLAAAATALCTCMTPDPRVGVA